MQFSCKSKTDLKNTVYFLKLFKILKKNKKRGWERKGKTKSKNHLSWAGFILGTSSKRRHLKGLFGLRQEIKHQKAIIRKGENKILLSSNKPKRKKKTCIFLYEHQYFSWALTPTNTVSSISCIPWGRYLSSPSWTVTYLFTSLPIRATRVPLAWPGQVLSHCGPLPLTCVHLWINSF